MGELIKVDFGKKKIENTQEMKFEKEKMSLVSFYAGYSKISSAKLTAESISAVRNVLKPYALEELMEFMQQVTEKTITEEKLAFVKAVQQEIKFRQSKKQIAGIEAIEE
ncbi:MAG: hypothetical protein NTY33_02025 [Candidatus Moranbacteria bacterium]|nr:hypothetical protein [Candidatus Moranbacteria bacterium]